MDLLGRRAILLVVLAIAYFQPNSLAIKIPQNPSPVPLEWWQEVIIYQIYPRSHQDSDNDGVGDLKGIESRLDHFVEIGIGAVWISPIYTSPMADFGYDISNFTDIDFRFGTLADFLSMQAAMKERGIKLIMDFIPNHSSDQHEWFKKSVDRIPPYEDFYVWKDAKGFDENGTAIVPNNWVSHFGGSNWEWNEKRGQFYLHRYLKEQPDLNFENRAVHEAMHDAMKFWLDMGVDGFRMDAVAQMYEDQRFLDEEPDPNRPTDAIPEEYRYWQHKYTYNLPQVLPALAEFRKLVDEYSGNGDARIMTVEATIPTLDGLMPYYGTNEVPIAHFPCNFEFVRKLSCGFSGARILSIVDEWYTKMPTGRTANWNAGNHDTARIASRFGPNAVEAFNMIVHLLPGSSIMYYGEEIGMENTWISWEDTRDTSGLIAGRDRYQIFSRDPERTPMQWTNEKNGGFSKNDTTWLPMNPKFGEVNVKAQTGAAESHLENFKKISQLRKTDIWKYGSLETNAPNSGMIFGFSRILDKNGFLVLVNLGDTQMTVNAADNYQDVPKSATVYLRSKDYEPAETSVGTTVDTRSIVIGPKHSLVLEFQLSDSNAGISIYSSKFWGLAVLILNVRLCIIL